MKIMTIAAGSNCYLITDGEQHLMIDAGAPGMGLKWTIVRPAGRWSWPDSCFSQPIRR